MVHYVWETAFLFQTDLGLPRSCSIVGYRLIALFRLRWALRINDNAVLFVKASQQSRIRGHPSHIFLAWTARSQQAGFIPSDGVIWISLGDNCFLEQRIAWLNIPKRRPSL
jgi:hypothetical protein